MLIRPLLLSRHAEYAVGVDQKLHLNPRQTCRHWRNVLQVELRKTAAVFDEFAFTLKDVDLDVRLAINERCEHLSSRRRNGRVARNNFRHHPAHFSIPSDNGVTSSSNMSRLLPARISAWTAAPRATTSSGFNSVCGTRPNSSCTRRRTRGIRVEPPTITTSSIFAGFKTASCKAWRQGRSVRSMMRSMSLLNSSRVRERRYCSSRTVISARSAAESS